MKLFSIPAWIQEHSKFAGDQTTIPESALNELNERLQRFQVPNPDVSIIIPAFNEADNILQTLSSLSAQKTTYRTELIVANNNSTDQTQLILNLCGIHSIFVAPQGISYARQAGLQLAKGKFIANADADTLYPPTWLDALIKPLEKPNIACTYGMYSFIPSIHTSRVILRLYEIVVESLKSIKRKRREVEDVMGFNFAFKREDGLAVGGFKHDLNRSVTGRSEDGWMALCLLDKGKIQQVRSDYARTWTSDRRLMADGNLRKAFLNRVKREVKRLDQYLTSKGTIKHTAN